MPETRSSSNESKEQTAAEVIAVAVAKEVAKCNPISKVTDKLGAVLAQNYVITNHVKPFHGSGDNSYHSFKVQ